MSRAPDGLRMRLTVNFGSVDHDLLVVLPTSSTGADLYRLLGSPDSGLGMNRTPPLLTNQRTGRGLRHDELLIECDLVTGDRLVSVSEPGDEPPLELLFLTGPRQGESRVITMTGGVAGDSPPAIGRGTDPGFDHPSVSRNQARLELTASGVAIRDLGSTNGTTVNGRKLESERAVAVNPSDVVAVGDISFTVTSLPPGRRRTGEAPFAPHHGQLDFHPAPRAADPRPPSSIDLPEPPAQPPRRRFPLGAALLPLVMGGVMAVVFSPIFAVFMAMSPLMVMWTYVDDRRSGRRSYDVEREVFLEDLAAQRLIVDDTADRLAAWQRRRTPALHQITRWVRCGSPELWARRPRHDDFLTVAVGTADRPSSLTVTVSPQGSPELVAEAAAVADQVAIERAAPVELDLARNPVAGITGETAAHDVARSVVIQLVGLHSPRDLELMVLAPEQAGVWEWTKWLPHLSAGPDDAVGFGSCSIAADDDEALALFEALMARAERRASKVGERLEGGAERLVPHVVIVLHPPVGLSPASVARFLELVPAVGMSVLYVTADPRALPAEATVHIDVSTSAEVHYLAEGSTLSGVDWWRADADQSLALARDLAPLVDVTASGTQNGIPTTVTLPAVHDYETSALFDAGAMARRWSADPQGLAATLGADATGPVVVDLQADGPHGLVAGTTGSGKSELLQTMIADLAAHYPPSDLNFILIDYKGGSAFRECERLPHTVGFVTDLDDHLAARALVSLRAELRHRERVLAEFDVGDLNAMRARYRHSVNADLVLPSLVIVIDEFAALRTEVPEFVDGLVDVAQRGRSMGVHMILATQKPGGVITPQIDANTNIRVALRVAGEADSRDLIGVTDAADIATDAPGRALLKVGGAATFIPFQAAYVGGRSAPGPTTVTPGLASFGYGTRPGLFRPVEIGGDPDEADASDEVRSTDSSNSTDTVTTDLGRIVEAARGAWDSSTGGRALRRPWLPPLPAMVSLESLLTENGASAPGGLKAAIGLADRPEIQTQDPFHVDLAAVGHIAVYGSSGSGKTTLLRTLAGSLSGGDGVTVYGIDFGGGLEAIEPLPTVADVVVGSDLERLQLLVAMLEGEVTARLTAGDRATGPPIVALIDGFGPFWDTLETFDFGRQADRFARLMSQAPSAGVHFVVTADQRSAIPFNCLGTIGLRLLQRLASVDEYRTLGLNRAPNTELMVPGRTLVVDGPEVQVAVVGSGTAEAFVELAADLRARGVSSAGPPVRALSDVVGLHEISRAEVLSSVPIGLAPTHDEVAVDLIDQPTLLVAGSSGSGRSSALLTIGVQLASIIADRRAIVPKRTSPLAGGRRSFPTMATGDGIGQTLDDLAAEVEDRSRNGFDRPMVVAIDDADEFFDDNRATVALNTLVLKGRDAGLVVLMAVSSFRAGTAYETWIRAMRSNGHGLVLQPDGDKEEDLFDVRFPRGAALQFPVGRGYLVVRSSVQAVQLAVPESTRPRRPRLSEADGRMSE